jgi:hypothetical protein
MGQPDAADGMGPVIDDASQAGPGPSSSAAQKAPFPGSGQPLGAKPAAQSSKSPQASAPAAKFPEAHIESVSYDRPHW